MFFINKNKKNNYINKNKYKKLIKKIDKKI